MNEVTVIASNLSKYFEAYEFGKNFFNRFNLFYLKSIDNFKYPKHYGTSGDPTCYDKFLIIDNLYIMVNNVKYQLQDYESTLICSTWFVQDEIFTFEFDTEEEAMYFQLKYDS